jgi:hypothetical protein
MARTVTEGRPGFNPWPDRRIPGAGRDAGVLRLAAGAEIRNEGGVSDAPFTAVGTRPLYAAAVWGVAGVTLLLLSAITRLGAVALEPIQAGALAWWHVALYGGSIVFMAYTEGYRGFQRAWSPRVVARAMHVARNPRPLLVVLAPLVCMGFFHATRRRMIVSWVLTLAILTAVLAVRRLDQPYRGIVDAGVVVGLGWGLVALLWYFGQGLAGRAMPVPADVPGEDGG